ncbi:MAG: hypothetical protein LBS62_03885, partial [Clostridiales bacterium]|nr:hypothetical protein [Clostridiales bacterium]
MKVAKYCWALLLVVLTVADLSTGVFAKAMNKKYTREVRVQSAIQLLDAAARYEDGEAIVLAGDISLTQPLVFMGRGTITLDLNGFKLDVVTADRDAVSLENAVAGLVITDRQDGMGKLTAQCAYAGETPNPTGSAGIRVLDRGQSLVIENCGVEATGGNFGAGIGGSQYAAGAVTIRSGVVTAKGGMYGAGLGGGYQQPGGDILIEDGTITAVGGDYGAGIGTGGFDGLIRPQSTAVTITGGRVMANGGAQAAGIGGGKLQNRCAVNISGGNVSALGGAGGAGIGSGGVSALGLQYNGKLQGAVTISGGNVRAEGGSFGAGIGTGEGRGDLSAEALLEGRAIKLEGGNVLARGGSGGAGVGGGAYLSGGDIEICDTVMLEAFGGELAAGIGGGKGAESGKCVMLAGGKIYAAGGDFAAGIGSGAFSMEHLEPTDSYFQGRKNIQIAGGSVEAVAGSDAAAIGGGSGGSGARLFVSGGAVINAVSEWETTIGAGRYSYDNGSMTITGGNIRANNRVGAAPVDLRGKPVFRGQIGVYSSEDNSPVADAPVDILLDDENLLSVRTSADGKAVIYLPLDAAPIDVRAGADRARFDGGDFKFTEDGETALVFHVQNSSPLKILSAEATHYIGGRYDTIPLDYSGGGGNVTFSVLDNQQDIRIDAASGVLTIPVNVKPGEYTLMVNAFDDGQLADSAPFALTVKEKLLEIVPDKPSYTIAPGASQVLRVSTLPHNADVARLDWKVTAGDADFALTDYYSITGEKAAVFSAQTPGEYAVTVAAKDADANTAQETILVTVADETERLPREQAAPVFAGGKGAGEISAWNVNRLDAATASIGFYSDIDGSYVYELVNEGQNASGNFTEGGIVTAGHNSVTLGGLPESGAYSYKVRIINADGAESVTREIYVPAYQAGDISPPLLSELTAARLSPTAAALSFKADEEGELVYLTGGEGAAAKTRIVPGPNRVTIGSLDTEAPLRIYAAALDTLGNYTETIEVEIPGYSHKNLTVLAPSGLWTRREGLNTAVVGFSSEIEGELLYRIAPSRSLGLAPVLSEAEEWVEPGITAAASANEFTIENLPDGGEYTVSIAVRDPVSRNVTPPSA